MNGATWSTRSAQVPDTPEARETWRDIAADLEKGKALGWTPEVPHELSI